MDLGLFSRHSDYEWEIAPHGAMRVPAVIYASEALVRDMDDKVYEQAVNVATLPGIVKASYAMPDAHWGYGFPIGGVAAFDPDAGGVVSAGGVGFDISCGVRCLRRHLRWIRWSRPWPGLNTR
jgi:tRNA-splicing ligase RtcB (3'-phosphate/5'-hydroxy nucleic acid ligase)